MRCYALAEEASSRGLKSLFFMPEATSPIREKLRTIGAKWLPRPAKKTRTDTTGYPSPDSWWIVDSYQADLNLLNKLRHNNRVLIIDDLCSLPEYNCDAVINAAPLAPLLQYSSKARNARLLLGSSYSLIRKEFRQFCRLKAARTETHRVAIMLGGSDPKNFSAPILQHLHEGLPTVHFTVILGPLAKNQPEIAQLTIALGRSRLIVDPPNLAQELADVALVVTGAGGTLGELCALGQMAVALVVVDNQKGALQSCPYPVLDARSTFPDALLSTVKAHLFAEDGNLPVISRANALVDGLGCRRVVDILVE